jgi:hypothetical protein
LSSYPWSIAEHINTLEMRVALHALRWLLSKPHSIGSRLLLLLDSAVCYFGLRKGRSGASSLHLVLRQISALCLSSGISILPLWIPSEWNPADKPSRAFSATHSFNDVVS